MPHGKGNNMNIDYVLIGKRIREIRISKKITQTKLAEAVNLSDVYLSYIECGSRKIGLKALVNIAVELSTPVDFLISGHTSNIRVFDDYFNDNISSCTLTEQAIIYKTTVALVQALHNDK